MPVRLPLAKAQSTQNYNSQAGLLGQEHITHNVVHAQGAGTMLQQPRVDALLVELVRA